MAERPQQTGGTRLDLPALGGGPEGLHDDLLDAVRETAGAGFEVFGEVARDPAGAVLYLARDLTHASLVALRAAPAGPPDEYLLDVVHHLDASVPAPDGACARCGAPFTDWARFCGRCGANVWGDAGGDATRSREELANAVQEAARGRYEILGEMGRADGAGVVYFARDLASGRIVALRVQREADQQYSVGKTNVLRRLSVSVTPPRKP